MERIVVTGMGLVSPLGCGGNLVEGPIRPEAALAKDPTPATRVSNPKGASETRLLPTKGPQSPQIR